MSELNNLLKTSDDFFEISFEPSETNRLLNLFSDNKDTYGQNGNKDEIDGVLSHLVALDAARKESIKSNGNIDTPNVEFTIAYGVNGKRIEESMSVPLGMGHFEKGINYLRENFGVNLESNMEVQKEKTDTNTRLDKFCSALKIPPNLALDELDEKGWDTIGKMADLAKGLSSPELAGFLAGFQGAIKGGSSYQSKDKEMDNEKFAQLMATKLNMSTKEARQIIENAQSKKDKDSPNAERKNEVSQDKINEIKERSKVAIKNQKK
ncbi:hypothetical protein BA723_08055 [Helicobacter sp. CLO-3]|uniref:hypothetical protein n=1 Tax=Helicobacter sp. CLO-3 TaxID=211 RepID=UPI0008050A54|nr:hypothetical protein [Helicobacter sp. CLO-3]OBV28810.1 hypothetical protein BA723_08055 [Helicobacter sp. CLO-3]